MTPAEHRAFKARLLRAFMANKDKLGLGDDEQVLIAYRALPQRRASATASGCTMR